MNIKLTFTLLILLITSIFFIERYAVEKHEKSSLKEYLSNVRINSHYSVDYFSSYSSGAGTRELNISYEIQNQVPVSCKGKYILYMTDGTKIYDCDLRKLKNKEYNVLIFLSIQDILNNLKNMKEEGRFKLENRICFYDTLQTVCFNKNNEIVNYVRVEGPAYLTWNLKGYDSVLREATP